MPQNKIIEELVKKLEKFSSLLEVSKAINTLTDLPTLMNIITQAATKVADADRGSIFLLDKEKQELWTISAIGLDKGKEIRMPSNMGLAGSVINTGKIINIHNAYEDSRFNPEIDRKLNYRTKNILTLPLCNRQGEVIGALQVLNKLEGDFTKLDEMLMEAFSQQAAVAIENAQLYEKLKDSYEKLKLTQDQLIEAEKLAIVGQLSTGIAHEIRNQLASFSFIDLIIEEYPENESIREYANIMSESIRNIENIIDEVRNFAKKTESKYQKKRVFLSKIIDSLFNFIKLDPGLNKQDVKKEIKNNPEVFVDVNKIKQVLLNLLRNAEQSIENKGEITVSLSQEKDFAIIKVKDNGCGIPKENLKKIWEPFFTTKKEIGTGLGLDICKRIIEAHNGIIECESEPGKGTTFIIKLPMMVDVCNGIEINFK